MYDNIGRKIKGLARATFIILTIAAVIVAIALIAEVEPWIGVLVLLLGPVIAWLSSWVLYGFGELVEKSCEIAQNVCNGKNTNSVRTAFERTAKIERLRSQGLISEEEYRQAMSEGQ